MEDGVFHATEAGTPQGGVISPLLLNIALHGMEAALGVFPRRQGRIAGKRALVRYADDFVVFCETREDAERARDQLLPAWLAERGLRLSAEKTRIVHLSEGFDFQGFHVRHYPTPGITRTGWKLLITPSRKAVMEKRNELRELWLGLKGHSVRQVLWKLNPIIRGWANYYRTGVSSKVFGAMDTWMCHRAYSYVRHMHRNKSWRWCSQRYWGKLHPQRQDHWVFGDKRTGAYLLKFGWFKIIRHIMVRGKASPDDPSLREYRWARRRVNIRHVTASDVKLAENQDWVCPVCGMELFNGEELQRHHKQPRGMGGTDAYANRELVHLYCHPQRHARIRQASVQSPVRIKAAQGMAPPPAPVVSNPPEVFFRTDSYLPVCCPKPAAGRSRDGTSWRSIMPTASSCTRRSSHPSATTPSSMDTSAASSASTG